MGPVVTLKLKNFSLKMGHIFLTKFKDYSYKDINSTNQEDQVPGNSMA